MSERRRARIDHGRTGAARYVANELPPDMAMGPCLEVWADRDTTTGSAPSFRARRAWTEAVDEWATATGWAREDRPAVKARALARTRHAWSRAFLLARGNAELVDYFEGRTRGTVDE